MTTFLLCPVSRMVVTTDASNKGWGALCEGKLTFGLWSEEESGLLINCLEMLAVYQACQFFIPARHSGTPCASTLRQQVRGVIHKSPGRPRLEATLYAGERLSCVGSEQSALTEGNACAGQGSAMQMNQGADMLSRNNVSSEEWTHHPFAVHKIWEVFGRARVDLFASEDNSHCPIFFYKEHR